MLPILQDYTHLGVGLILHYLFFFLHPVVWKQLTRDTITCGSSDTIQSWAPSRFFLTPTVLHVVQSTLSKSSRPSHHSYVNLPLNFIFDTVFLQSPHLHHLLGYPGLDARYWEAQLSFWKLNSRLQRRLQKESGFCSPPPPRLCVN